MSNQKINTFFATLFIALSFYLSSCENQSISEKDTNEMVCKILKSKHSENQSTNLRGDFIVVHYFLYQDGSLEEVDLKDYMSFEVEDTICWNSF